MSFTTDLQFFRLDALGEQKRVRDAVTLKLFGAVIRDTPVDTGRARGAWVTNVEDDSETREEEFASASSAVEGCRQVLVGASPSDSIFITNNVPYVAKLEYGSSKQAPAGMMRKNVTRFQMLIDREATRRMGGRR